MKTAKRLNNNLLLPTKHRALKEHTSFMAIVENALRAWLNKKINPVKQTKIRIPTSGSGGLQPGVDLDNTSGLLDRMD